MRATYIEVEAEVRYWEDASVNGHEDTDGTLIPFRLGNKWCPVIRLEDGWIVNWPECTTADVHYKVCDQGEYWLRDEEKRIAKWSGDYVPNDFLCHGDQGYGDYIIFQVNAEGTIVGWDRPWLDPERWLPCQGT
jgi:hypothetical protein